MEGMRPPAGPEQPVDLLTEDELRALIDAARGNTFKNRRDTAMLRMLIDTGMRAPGSWPGWRSPTWIRSRAWPS